MKTLIIAEAGINHDGDTTRARQLIDGAKRAGADAVKFQTFIPEKIARDEQELANLKRYALTSGETLALKAYCDEVGIEFMSTPFCCETADWLNAMGVRRFKISSGNVTNMALIKQVATYRKPVILSLGMSKFEEREAAISTLLGYGMRPADITLMHCRSIYPTPPELVNLGMLRRLDRYKMRLGFSDHSMSVIIPSYAVAAGASVIEKHFTLWKDAPGADHAMSLDEPFFADMVRTIRDVEVLMSSGPAVLPGEEELRTVWLEKVRRQNG